MSTLKTMFAFLIVFSFLSFFATPARGQIQSISIPVEDLQQLRKLAADRDYQLKRADEAEKQSGEWQRSSERWRGLYESEKKRADETQGARIAELNGAITEFKTEVAELKKANQFLHDQRKADAEQIGQLNFDVRKLKSERKYYFMGGAAVGGVGGFYVGKNINRARDVIVNNLTPSAQANGFRASFQF